MNSVTNALVVAGLSLALVGSVRAQDKTLTVTLVPPVHGKVQLTRLFRPMANTPPARSSRSTATPDPGYALDSAWYSVPGRFGRCITRA